MNGSIYSTALHNPLSTLQVKKMSRLMGIISGAIKMQISQNYNQLIIQANRSFCQQKNVVNEGLIIQLLKKKFPSSEKIQVEDVSGGCGAMFNIYIETSEFKGLSIPKQHRIVYDTLKEQIKNIHGLHLETRVPG